jgi:broad specificity phosphatase PhoE
MNSARVAAVKRTFEAFQRLDRAQVAGETLEAAQTLYDSVDGLAAVGCEIEGRFVHDLHERLCGLQAFNGREGLSAHLQYSSARLAAVPWLPAPSQEGEIRSSPPQLIFVRHAESTGNVEKRLQGARIGGALTKRGHAQSNLTAAHLFDAFEELRGGNAILVSSPGNRAVETAKAIGDRLGCPVRTHDGLAEIDFGEWTGRYFADLESDSDYVAWMKDKWFHVPPGGESLFEVRSRVFEALSWLLSIALARRRPLVVVTHFFPLMACFTALTPGTASHSDNSSITRFELDGDGWKSTHTNFVRHLGGEAAAPVAYV